LPHLQALMDEFLGVGSSTPAAGISGNSEDY
jgi:hypothetical protein